MEKHCANHPESMALSACKACEKSICLMCVVDEKEGTFCSEKCVKVFREVSDWVDTGNSPAAAASSAAGAPTAAPPAVETPPPQAVSTGSIFDQSPAPEGATEQAQFEPLVSPGTKWRMIGSMCAHHADTPAIATCERCGKTVCALCVMEASTGTFCNECGAAATQAPPPAPVPMPPPAARPSTGQVRTAPPRPPTVREEASSGGRLVTVVVLLLALGVGGYFAYTHFMPAENAGPNPPIAITNPKPPPPPPPPVPPNPSKVTPPKIDPPKVDPPKTDPPKVDPPKVDPPKTDPPKVDPPKTDPPKPPPKPEMPGRILNPWANEEPGTWYRIMTTGGGETTFVDLGLKQKTFEAYVLNVQAHSKGKTDPASDVTTVVPQFWSKGEETLVFNDRSFLCEIRETKTPQGRQRSWVLIEGRHVGAVLKREGAMEKLTTRRVWEHSLRIQGRPFECLVVESELDRGGVKSWIKIWHSGELPMGTLRSESGGTSTSLVDMGDDWSKRPPFPN
jgi:hypothetical protein